MYMFYMTNFKLLRLVNWKLDKIVTQKSKKFYSNGTYWIVGSIGPFLKLETVRPQKNACVFILIDSQR